MSMSRPTGEIATTIALLSGATLLGGVLAGRAPGAPVNIEDRVVENMYLHFLAFASEIDPKSAEVGAMLDLTQSSILPS